MNAQHFPDLRLALRLAMRRQTVLTATRLALVVGPLLILINQWDALFGTTAFNAWKAALTMVVPYCVSTWTAVSNALSQSAQGPRQA
ncbi:MAG: nitrate/nitrite transporter NrtS [Alcanivoracaceae bacterium]|nr:nitrate/nitrite transporter NrtS [Alcanivoracaceae bacterium]